MSRTPEPETREDAILRRIRGIPEGFVRTYGDVSPGAPRLAGRVLAGNKDRTLPWWRVVRADGTFALGAKQRKRLLAEDVPFRPGSTDRVDLAEARVPERD